MLEIVIATRNPGKVKEIERIMAGLPVRWLTWRDFRDWPEVEENGATFRENALIKARAVAGFTGLPALADDSGLEVEALGGAPGVFSARYAGEQADDRMNVARLLEEMRDVPPERRGARFVCRAALFFPQGRCLEAEGTCRGTIADAPRGEGGFGYDPVFIPQGYDLSFAELPPREKDSLSHRGRALAALRAALEAEAAARRGPS
jgi:XTP/dITP diphosphohydrolase